ncbi:hypothetical protein HBB16_07415 [Pseudonocardia sp. MCCB 268]|nr:hypothetical protein [Pseudonocardia cytotoxica]
MPCRACCSATDDGRGERVAVPTTPQLAGGCRSGSRSSCSRLYIHTSRSRTPRSSINPEGDGREAARHPDRRAGTAGWRRSAHWKILLASSLAAAELGVLRRDRRLSATAARPSQAGGLDGPTSSRRHHGDLPFMPLVILRAGKMSDQPGTPAVDPASARRCLMARAFLVLPAGRMTSGPLLFVA